MRKYTVSDDAKIRLNGEIYLLERGDNIILINNSFSKTDVIDEGIIDKAKEMAKRAISTGIEKILPQDWINFAKGLIDAAKKGPEQVAEFLGAADQDKVLAIASIDSKSTDMMDESMRRDVAIEEGGAEELMSRSTDVASAIEAGSSAALNVGVTAALIIVGLASAYGLYKVIQTGIQIYKDMSSPERKFNR